jgi:pimeloyl-ACP methyl ester carboxylesterase
MAFANNGDCEVFYEAFGSRADPTLLLVNGLGSQCINYHEDWCAMFAAAGFHVIRFDNRDVGLSTHFGSWRADADEVAPYRVDDMAGDALAVLDEVGVVRAHVMGLSMGGMIVQHLAIHHPARLLSVVAVMTRTDEADFGQPTPAAVAQFGAPPAIDRESAVTLHLSNLRAWGSPAFVDEDRARADAERAFDRCFDPGGSDRQLAAIQASGPWAQDLPGVTTPMLVMHGTADTLIDISGGRRVAALVPGARFVAIEGMGHDYPPQLWRRWVDEVSTFCHG